MPYTYSKGNIFFARLLEVIVFIIYKSFNFFIKPTSKVQIGINKILIIEPFQMGDVIALSVMIEPLKKKFPNSLIMILTKEKNKNVFEFDNRINVITSEFPWSDYDKKWNFKRYIKLFSDIIRYRKLRISIGIDPRGDIRSQFVLLLIGCKQRIGYINYVNSNIYIKGLLLTKKIEKPSSEHRYDWNSNILYALDIKDSLPINFPTIKLDSFTLDKKNSYRKFVLIHPGAGWVYRQWPISNWVKLIERMLNSFNVKISIIIGENETDILIHIKELINNNIIEYKSTTYKELIKYIKLSDLFICLDSGPMNLAVCMNKPVIALFGPGDSDIWKPYSSNSLFIHKRENFPCNPCFQKICYYPNKNCMAVITIEEVMNLVNKFFK